MKIAIVGASGTIGKAVVKRLEKEHEVIKMGRSSGDVLIDMSRRETRRKEEERREEGEGREKRGGEGGACFIFLLVFHFYCVFYSNGSHCVLQYEFRNGHVFYWLHS